MSELLLLKRWAIFTFGIELYEFLIYFELCIGYVGEVNGTPLQYSCLENPMDGGAW